MKTLIAVSILLFGSFSAFSDEQVRRVQEELRKRNLYFGDVNGSRTEQTISAIRRYQERKGFPASGELDAVTLSSLDLAPPDTSTQWPEVAVLKSDRAREIAEEDRKFLEQVKGDVAPTPIGEAPLEEPPMEDVVPPPSPPKEEASPNHAERPAKPVAPPPPAARPPIPSERAESFVRQYLATCETNRLQDEMKYYADKVRYFDHGVVGRDFIEKDVAAYYKRWPERSYKLRSLEVVDSRPGSATVKFQIAFNVKNQKHSVTGKTANTFTMRETSQGLKFTAVREQRLRE